MGAATLLIHMLANVAMHIKVNKTTLGFDPAAFKTLEAVMTSSRVFDSTAAIVKPPSKRPIVGENMTEKMYLLASLAGIRSSLPSVVRSTPSATVKNGTKKLVTNKGIAWERAISVQLDGCAASGRPLLTSVAHNSVQKINIAKQLLSSCLSKGLTLTITTRTIAATTQIIPFQLSQVGTCRLPSGVRTRLWVFSEEE